MIKQAPVKGRNAIKVSFVLPQDAIPGKTSVVGDFNGWDPLAHPLRPRANGTGSASRASSEIATVVPLKTTEVPARRIAFRTAISFVTSGRCPSSRHRATTSSA